MIAMHKLTRTTEPAALMQARVKKIPDWDSFPSREKKAVRDELLLGPDKLLECGIRIGHDLLPG